MLRLTSSLAAPPLVAGDAYLVPSASRPGAYHRCWREGGVWICSCEAGDQGIFHWHTALISTIEYAIDLNARLAAHRAGWGAAHPDRRRARRRLRSRQNLAGDRTLERKLKNRKESPRFCPLCFPTARHYAAIEAEQLELPFDFPTAPALRAAWMEISTLRRWRATVAAPLAADWDDGLL
jgi:hypothetical protein